jgi:hypothetical protein
VRPCKIKKKVIYFQYAVAQSKPSCSKREEQEDSKEESDQNKTETQQDKH